MRRILAILFVVFLVLYLLTGVTQVRPGERAVVRRFGQVLNEKPVSGLWIGLPWGMDRVDRVEVDTVRSLDVGFDPEAAWDDQNLPTGQMLTGDNNLVNVQVTLYYKVVADEVADFVLQGEKVTAILSRLVEATAAEWVAGRSVDDVLLRGKVAMGADLKTAVEKRLRGYRLGVEVLDARVARVGPPEEVREAFESVSREQTKIATERNRAEQEAETRLRSTRADAYRIEQTAQASAHGRRVAAKQDAERFTVRLAQYLAARKENPNYLRQLWQEERAKLFAKLKERGQLDLLDDRLNGGSLDVIMGPGK